MSAAFADRYLDVLKFHPPGLAPAREERGWLHIDAQGEPAYPQRYTRTFGFYEGLAAVDAGSEGWFHIRPDGSLAYAARWAWAGNVQGGRCTVRQADGRYLHIRPDGSAIAEDRWRYAGDYRDGVAVVQAEDGRSTHVDLDGRPLHGRWFLDLDVFHKGYARARDELGWMHVDGQGVPAYDKRFAAVEPFYNGAARVERFDGGLEVIDERGRRRVELRPTPHAEPVQGTVLARTAWGRVTLVEPPGGAPYVEKWTRGSNDREVEALLALRGHPGVPALLGRERLDMNDRLQLAYVPGPVVGDPRRLRAWPEDEAIRVTREVLDVCVALHAAGWVHTDIHPGNVIVSRPAVLLDFATAVRATAERPWRGEINWGVWEYVAPEQLADYGEIGPAADVYAAAALCVAMLRGAPPYRVGVKAAFAEGGWPAVRSAFLEARARGPGPTGRPRLDAALTAALALAPADRPTARELAMELHHV